MWSDPSSDGSKRKQGGLQILILPKDKEKESSYYLVL